jgi:polyhydroxyalkanoate synthesis regulator phasin
MTKKENATQDETTAATSSFGLLDISRKVLLAGVGAAVLAQDEISDFVDHLVERGEIAEQDARKLIKEVLDKQQKFINDVRSEQSQKQSRYATRSDIEELTTRIMELNKKLEELQSQKQA